MRSASPPSVSRRRARRPAVPALVLIAIFFTNLLSLACQVLWSRKLAYLFGSTAAVFSTVLSVFLLGLATGALVAGRMADRSRRPWRLLAGLEILLGVYCLLSLGLFELGRSFYLAVFPNDLAPLPAALAKFLVVLVVMITPTFSIGAAFSVAVRIASRERERLGRDVSLVYGLDTLGAAAGALAAGFVFVPMLGLAASTRLLGIAAVVLGLVLLGRRREKASPKKKKSKETGKKAAGPPAEPGGQRGPRSSLALILGAFFLSGCAALLLETGWIRFFSLLNGTHVYSSSTVLAGFLAGIGIGSLLMAPRIDRLRDPAAAAAYLFAAIALGGMLVFRSADLFARVYFAIFARSDGYYVFQLTVCGFIALLVFLPTLAMGANFPLVAKIATRKHEERGFAVGRAYFVNTLGAVAGAFLAEFVVLPAWGFAGLMLVTLIAYAIAAAVFLAQARAPQRLLKGAVCSVLLAVALVVSPAVWKLELPFHALYCHGLRTGSWEKYQAERARLKVLDEKQSFYGQVTVVELDRDLLLKHNGKTDASTAVRDNRTQLLLAHLPLVFHPNPRRVLAIGLGGGFTLRALLSHDEPAEVTMVEIDPQVIAAAREFFAGNRDALNDPRVRIVTNDGRNYLDSSPQRFDVITSEPPNIWVAGVSGLFTQEFYRSVDAHLRPGGILCQWVPLYEMEREDFRIMLKTIRSVFAHVTFWQIRSDLAILASNRPFRADPEQVKARLRHSEVARDLAEIGMSGAEMFEFLGDPAVRPEHVAGFLGDAESVAVNTDDLPELEFRTARNLFVLAKEEQKAEAIGE